MIITRNQASNRSIKEETDDDNFKPSPPFHSCKRVINSNCKITKKKTPKLKRVLVPTLEIKQEDTDSKLMITSLLNKPKRFWVTSEQIKKLIGYITEDKMTIKMASEKAGMKLLTGQIYYQRYMDDPDHRLPLPRLETCNKWRNFTSEEIRKLIRYTVDDKMTLIQAAEKLKMSASTAFKYRALYRNNPEHKVFRSDTHIGGKNNRNQRVYTCNYIKRLNDHTVNDNMSETVASRKVGKFNPDALGSYSKYIDDPELKMTASRGTSSEKVKALINYVVDDKMPISGAARKLHMPLKTASDYFNRYFADPRNKGVSRPKLKNDPLEDGSIKSLLSYIFNDKLSIKESAQKLGIGLSTAFKYYNRFKDNPDQYSFIPKSIMKKASTKNDINDKLKKMFEFITNDNMKLSTAAKKANVSRSCSKRYYDLYLNDPEHKIPQAQYYGTPPEKIKELAHYIINDKMTTQLAAKKANITYYAAVYHFSRYRSKNNINISS